MKPFDYVNEILQGKKNLIVDDETEKGYNPYLTNKALSNHLDCIGLANEMNQRPHLDNKLQFLFFINTVRSMKRPFNKWEKAEKLEDLECVKTYYGYSDSKARQAILLLTEEQIQIIRQKTDIGGLRN